MIGKDVSEFCFGSAWIGIRWHNRLYTSTQGLTLLQYHHIASSTRAQTLSISYRHLIRVMPRDGVTVTRYAASVMNDEWVGAAQILSLTE